MKRFTRPTASHSKKIDNHVHMVALYTTWYNFARINSAVRMSPAMAAHLTERLWAIADIVKLIEEWEANTNAHQSTSVDRHAPGQFLSDYVGPC
jgi:hypothetical protein